MLLACKWYVFGMLLVMSLSDMSFCMVLYVLVWHFVVHVFSMSLACRLVLVLQLLVFLSAFFVVVNAFSVFVAGACTDTIYLYKED